MSRVHAILAALFMVLLVFGCASEPAPVEEGDIPELPPADEPVPDDETAKVRQEEQPQPGQEPQEEMPETAQPGLPQPGVEAQDDEWQKIAEEAMKAYTLGEQQQISESQNYYRIALAYRDRGDFEKSKQNCERAVQIWPGNVEARKLLAEINQIRVGGREQYGAVSVAQDQLDRYRVQVEQATLEITNHIRNGERYYNARMFDDAIDEFENAEFKIRAIPLDVPKLKDLLPKVQSMISRAEWAKEVEERRVEVLKREEAQKEAATLALAEKREVLKKIAQLLELAFMAFDQQEFDNCIKLCGEILVIDPHYRVAKDLIEDAKHVRHRREFYDVMRLRIDRWKRMTENTKESLIPYSETVLFPSSDEWAFISKRIEETILKTSDAVTEEDPEILAINNKLESMRIDMGFESAPLEDIIAFIRDFTQLNFVIDAAVRDDFDIESPITFKVKNLVLKNVLKLLLSQYGLDYVVTPERVVLITEPGKAGGEPVLEIHDIRDILVQIRDFTGPIVELRYEGSGHTPLAGATFTLDEPKEASVGEDAIIDLIRDQVEPQTWEEGDYDIELTPNKQLLVNHTPRVQKKIREFLAKLRSYTGTMVSVTVRFIAAYDDWMDDVGSDIINRPPVGTGWTWPTDLDLPATRPSRDVMITIDEPTGEIGAGFSTQESARLEEYDLRAQTFHTLLKIDPFGGVAFDPMSGRLVNQGGLGMQYQWLGEQGLQLVLRGLHKDEKATIVMAPSVTVFNTQRSHILFLTQVSYIQDVDPQVGTFVAAYDPIIGILSHGVVLDVRPIVSNDRKWVTMEMRPSFAELQLMRDVPLPFGAIIQLPWIVLQRAECTIQCPDRGALILAGLRDLNYTDLHSGVPFLEHIPILNFFFTRRGKHSEWRRLFILVSPEIIDLHEWEEKTF
ncbi:MAG: hypothetical protein ACYTAF_01965 [Planctomycetota bacterium]|jgi:tetratricopeptide (TPR) repeat protein